MTSTLPAIEALLRDDSLRKELGRWLNDPADADDVLQGVAEKLLGQRIPVLTKSYLHTVLRNSAIDLRRADQRRERNVSGLASEDRSRATPAPEESLQAMRTIAAVQAILDRQPPLSRKIFRLYHLQNMTQPEIATLLDVHLSTVEKRLAKVRNACVKEMQAHLD